MIIQQNCVYVLIEHSHMFRDGIDVWGVYPNFNAAYERLEELSKGKVIVDKGDYYSSAMFETIEVTRDARHHEYYGHCYIHRYSICRRLMNIRDGDKLIIPEMIDEIVKANKERGEKSRYKVINEII